jgi:CubicO group peptidase (beta-lactamase class C family)
VAVAIAVTGAGTTTLFSAAVATAGVPPAGGSALSSQAEFPETPAGRAAEAYFKAFNAGEAAMKEYISRYTAQEALKKMQLQVRMARYRQMKAQVGTLDPQEVVEARADFLGVHVRGQAGRLLRFEFTFEPAPPYGLLGIQVEVGASPDDQGPAPDPKKSDAELAAAVRAHARRAAEAGEFSGVILIARNNEPIFEEAFGIADRENGTPNTVDTKFNVGSINKSFTALAVRLLLAEGKVALDDTIGKFLPDYPNKTAAERVTVRHLLDMSSGIGDFFGDRFAAADKEKIRGLADYLPFFADRPLAFEPGHGNLYSNGGYIVLGLIIEKASGVDYYAFVRDRVFQPAGMGDSGWTPKNVPLDKRAVGYVREETSWRSNYDTLPGIGSSAGGGHSTARDLLKYTIALETGAYGAAWADDGGGLGIAGGAPGINAALEWMPDERWTIIVMANLSPPAATRMARQIRAWLPR